MPRNQTRKKSAKRSPPIIKKTTVNALDDLPIYKLNIAAIEDIPEPLQRKAYSELRSVAKLRLKALKNAGYDQSFDYLNNVGKFPTITEMRQDAAGWGKSSEARFRGALVGAIRDAALFLTDKTTVSDVKSSERKTIETLHQKGGAYAAINESNIKEFGLYMEELRQKGKIARNTRGSEQAVALFRTMQEKNMRAETVMKDFDFWRKNQGKLRKIAKHTRSGKSRNAADFRKILKKKEAKTTRKAKKKKK